MLGVSLYLHVILFFAFFRSQAYNFTFSEFYHLLDPIKIQVLYYRYVFHAMQTQMRFILSMILIFILLLNDEKCSGSMYNAYACKQCILGPRRNPFICRQCHLANSESTAPVTCKRCSIGTSIGQNHITTFNCKRCRNSKPNLQLGSLEMRLSFSSISQPRMHQF